MNDFSINSPKLSNESVNIVPPAGDEDGKQVQPPDVNKGVEFSNFGLHWLRATIYEDVGRLSERFNEAFGDILGKMVELPYGWRGYKASMVALLETKIYYNPVNGGSFCTLDFTGKACEAVPPELLIEFFGKLKLDGIRCNITRLDIRWDRVGFSPAQFMEAVQKNKIRSLVKRTSWQWDVDGRGNHTFYLGMRSSERLLRVYDEHGFTRIELEMKDARASLVFSQLLDSNLDSWNRLAISHLRDFVDVFEDWWSEFCGAVNRAYAKVSKAREICMTKMVSWLDSQVAPALSVVADCLGVELLQSIIKRGRRRRDKYMPILSAFGALSGGVG